MTLGLWGRRPNDDVFTEMVDPFLFLYSPPPGNHHLLHRFNMLNLGTTSIPKQLHLIVQKYFDLSRILLPVIDANYVYQIIMLLFGHSPVEFQRVYDNLS